MSTVSLRLPESLHKMAKTWARRERVSVNQVIANALAEKLSALATEEYLEAMAARGSRDRFKKVLAKVKNRPPLAGDEL